MVVVKEREILVTFSIMINSLASKAIFWPAKALEDDICCLSLQKYVIEMACMFLGSIALALVTIIKVEREEKSLKTKTVKRL